MRYACIRRRRNQYPVDLMCLLLAVSRGGYYAWRSRHESQRAQDDRHLMQAIKRIHAASGGVYGSPRIWAELKEEGYRCGRHKELNQLEFLLFQLLRLLKPQKWLLLHVPYPF